jgi:hypothetical protein
VSEIPPIKVLEAITPANSGTGEEMLVYQGLAAAVEKYSPTTAARTAEVWDSQPDSLEERLKAKQLASEYLLKTANMVVNSNEGNRDVWADRFTRASVEIYGEPEASEAARLITTEYNSLAQLQGNKNVSQQQVDLLLDSYEPIVANHQKDASAEAGVELEKQAIHQYGEVMLGKYQPLFDLIDQSGKTRFDAADLRQLFNSSLKWLEENDDVDWGEWEAVDAAGTSLAVNTTHRKIRVASHRESADVQETRGLLGHELLVHVMRAKNGYKTGDRRLAIGLPGYLEAEEGLGILAEEAVNGELPGKAQDRYVDVALALGTVDGVQRTRKEVFQISFARQLVREQAKGIMSQADIASLEHKVWTHVDRIYRGGPGDDLGTKQAVFTKDIAYYVGYKQMAGYISGQLASGKPAAEVFDYLSQAKFDPNNPQHLARLNA